jgi:predicted metalloprotease with PDZ domain
MRAKLLPLMLGLLFGVVTVGLVPVRATDPAIPEVVVLPPMLVEGKFSELVCGVRFRYGVPGNRMRSLVVRRMPASWATAGVKTGDTIVAIDGRKIDGQGLAELGKYLSSKPKDKPVSYSFEIRSKKTKAVQRLEMAAERESGEITIAYP